MTVAASSARCEANSSALCLPHVSRERPLPRARLIRSTLLATLFSEVKNRRAVYLTAAASALFLGFAGCAPKPLPELGSSTEQLYAGRCGGCHRPFLPSTMTSAMWGEQVEAMQLKMTQAGVAPLSAAERREILDYLERNAGKD